MKILPNDNFHLAFAKFLMVNLILFSTFTMGCSNKEIFSEFHSFPQSEWDQQKKVQFEVLVTDTSLRYDVSLAIRNNDNYPFRNLFLFIDYQMPNGHLRSDTLHTELADIYGKCFGCIFIPPLQTKYLS